MKNFIIPLFFFALTFNLWSQEYTPFPKKNAFWSAMHCEPGPMVPKSGLAKVGVFGDTVINSKTYSKLYLQRKFVNFKFSCDTCGFVFDKDSAYYFMSFREENKIIYFVPQQNGFGDPDGAEYPVFNFNLSNVGETIIAYQFLFLPFGASSDPTPTPGCGVMNDTVTLTVKSFDIVMMSDGSLRRRINFEPLYYGLKESWIEGIGSTKGFGLSLNVTNSNNTMVCFSHNGVNLETAEILSQQLCTYHPDSTLTFKDRCEYTSTSAVDEPEIDNNISVLPNPFSDFFKITKLNPGDKVKIYNLLGQAIYEEISKSNELVIDKFEFNQGIYIFTINSLDKDIRTGKMIKQ